MISWLTGYYLVGWLVGCLVVWLVVSLISDSLVASLIVWLVDCLVVYLFVGYLLRFLFVYFLFVYLVGWLDWFVASHVPYSQYYISLVTSFEYGDGLFTITDIFHLANQQLKQYNCKK